jgi:hypothetical protein
MGRAVCPATRAPTLSDEALMGELPTAKDYSGVHTVHAVCRDPACDHWQELELAAIAAAGHGNVALIRLPLRCSLCGKTGHEIKVIGRSYGLAE